MAESTNDIFRRNHCKTPEWIADFKFLPHIVFTKSSGYQFSVYKFFLKAVCSRVINPLLTKLARDRTGKISTLGLFCTDLAALGPYCQDLGPIFSQYGPRAWLIRYIYQISNIKSQISNKKSLNKSLERISFFRSSTSTFFENRFT